MVAHRLSTSGKIVPDQKGLTAELIGIGDAGAREDVEKLQAKVQELQDAVEVSHLLRSPAGASQSPKERAP